MNDPLILIAEDDALLTKMYKRIIEYNDWNCISVSNGDDALAALSESNPDVMVLDLHMPGKDGYDVLQGMNDTNMSVPVIVLTNMSDPEDKRRCEEFGVSKFFIKSEMDLDNLAEMVKEYL